MLNLRSADTESLSLPTLSGAPSSRSSLRFRSLSSWGNIGAPLDVGDQNVREFERELYEIEEVGDDEVAGPSGTTHEPGVVGEYRAVPKDEEDEDEVEWS